MIDPDLAAKLDAIEAKAEQAFRAAESARKYLVWTGIITTVLFVVPLVGLLLAVPQFIGSYTSSFESLGL